MVVLVMLPFEVITNSCSRNYRAKSLPTQPRIDAVSHSNERRRRQWRGSRGGRCRTSAGAKARRPYINALPPHLLRTPGVIRSIGAQLLVAAAFPDGAPRR